MNDLGFKTTFAQILGLRLNGKEKWQVPRDGPTKTSRNSITSGDHSGSGTSVSELLCLGQLQFWLEEELSTVKEELLLYPYKDGSMNGQTSIQ